MTDHELRVPTSDGLGTGSLALRELWHSKTDEELAEAARSLANYTERGRRVIRAELERRGLEAPEPQLPEEEPVDTVCPDCHGVLVYRDPVLANVVILQSVLESHEIPCEIRQTHFNYSLPVWPELWLFDAALLDEARQAIQATLKKSGDSDSWTCPRCDEAGDGSFELCWSCGSPRPS